jgi:hypothetical protein
LCVEKDNSAEIPHIKDRGFMAKVGKLSNSRIARVLWQYN